MWFALCLHTAGKEVNGDSADYSVVMMDSFYMSSLLKIRVLQEDAQLYLKKILFGAVKNIFNLDIFLAAKLIDI